ncbi:MAG: NUDIX domain-containing protein [Chloroflexota bacterium]
MREVRQAGCVVLHGNEVVLRHTAAGHWVFPKGHVEPGETDEQAAVREVAEETGLAVRLEGPLGEADFPLDDELRRVRYFVARVTAELPEWNEHRDRDAFLLPTEGVRGLLSFPNLRALWDEFTKRKKEQSQ